MTWVINETKKYEDKLKIEPQDIESIKSLLNVINEIRNKSLDIELKINEVLEQFRVLKMYKYEVTPEDQEQVDQILDNWNILVEKAERKDFEVNEFKVNFSQITEDRVKEFKDMLAEAYRNYLADGPGAEQVSLEDGVDILQDYIEKCREYTIKKEENVLSEILFNLPISKFDELIKMDKNNAIYT